MYKLCLSFITYFFLTIFENWKKVIDWIFKGTGRNVNPKWNWLHLTKNLQTFFGLWLFIPNAVFFAAAGNIFYLHYILYLISALNNQNILFILKRGWFSASYPFSKFCSLCQFSLHSPKFEVFTRYNALLYKINTFYPIIWPLYLTSTCKWLRTM